jgi:hypothetical protein
MLNKETTHTNMYPMRKRKTHIKIEKFARTDKKLGKLFKFRVLGKEEPVSDSFFANLHHHK